MGRDTDTLRAAGEVPAVVYGAGVTPSSVSVNRVAFVKTYEKAGTSGLVELEVEGGASIPVLIQTFSQHPVSNTVDHIDFHAVDLLKEVEAEIQLHLVGEAPAVKGLGGTLVAEMSTLHVRALPTALVAAIEVNVSPLATFADRIYVRDIILPVGIKIEEDELGRIVASVDEPRSEAELAALNEAVEENIEAVEVVEKKKGEEEGEEEEGKAGAAPEEKKDKKKE